MKRTLTAIALLLAGSTSAFSANAAWEVFHDNDSMGKMCALSEKSLEGSSDLQFAQRAGQNITALYVYEKLGADGVRPSLTINGVIVAAEGEVFTDSSGVEVVQYVMPFVSSNVRAVNTFIEGGIVQINNSAYDASGFKQAFKELVKCASQSF